MLIELATNSIKFSEKLLGSEEAWVWVGSAYSPIDNDDERVRATRELMEKYYPYIPYGMLVGNKEGDTMIPLKNSGGSYVLNLDWWPVGVYRINLHTTAGIQSPFGSKLHPEKRDQDCSWIPLEAPQWLDELRPFLHREENGAGYSLRFLIRPDRSTEPLGDQPK